MAHLRSLIVHCDAGSCRKRATVELYSRWNAAAGRFCRPCGQRSLRELEASEQPPTAKPPKGSPF